MSNWMRSRRNNDKHASLQASIHWGSRERAPCRAAQWVQRAYRAKAPSRARPDQRGPEARSWIPVLEPVAHGYVQHRPTQPNIRTHSICISESSRPPRTILSCLIYHLAALVQRYPFSSADFASKEQTFISMSPPQLPPISIGGLLAFASFAMASRPRALAADALTFPTAICGNSSVKRPLSCLGGRDCLDCNETTHRLGGRKVQTAWFGVPFCHPVPWSFAFTA